MHNGRHEGQFDQPVLVSLVFCWFEHHLELQEWIIHLLCFISSSLGAKYKYVEIQDIFSRSLDISRGLLRM